MTTETNVGVPAQSGQPQGQQQLSLGTAAAKNLATTTKSEPQMQGISSRWLLRMLPWTQVAGGTYRVNRRLSYAVGRGRVSFVKTGSAVRVVPPTLGEIPVLRGFQDDALLEELASRFTQREFQPGEVLVEAGQPISEIFLIAHGKVNKVGTSKYGEKSVVGVLADGDHLGDEALTDADGVWAYGVKAATAGTLLSLPWPSFQELADRSEALRDQILQYLADAQQSQNKHGEAEIELAAGHEGEHELPGTFVDYELAPREYELSVAQTVLQVHSRVADLYNQPMNQIEQQLRLTDRGAAGAPGARAGQQPRLRPAPQRRAPTSASRPTPARPPPTTSTSCSAAAVGPSSSWPTRGRSPRSAASATAAASTRTRPRCTATTFPPGAVCRCFPCNKIPIVDGHTSSILAMRVGEDNQGVIGLHQTGIPDEYQPSLSVRFMGINEKAIISYLVSAYYSAAILVPDAIGVLENVEISRPRG